MSQSKKSAAVSAEIKALILAQAVKPKAAPVAKEETPQTIYTALLPVVKADNAAFKADGAVYAAWNAFLGVYIAEPRSAGQLAATLVSITTLYAANKPTGILRKTMLTNVHTVVFGKAAGRKEDGTTREAQPAQGADKVQAALEECQTLRGLKTMLATMKIVKHASTGVAKQDTGKAAVSKPAPVISTREQAIKAAVDILQQVAREFLTVGKDAPIISEVDKLVKMLRAA